MGHLVGGFNPVKKYWSKWESSPSRGEHKKHLKPPPRTFTEVLGDVHFELWWVHLAAGVVHAQVQQVTGRMQGYRLPWMDTGWLRWR